LNLLHEASAHFIGGASEIARINATLLPTYATLLPPYATLLPPYATLLPQQKSRFLKRKFFRIFLITGF
jgi:hypothetical protein